MATPSSRAVLRRPIWSDSMSRLKGEYLFLGGQLVLPLFVLDREVAHSIWMASM
jgi:hypothetical protein